ncbi:phospholipase C, phosphocholine-specific [Kribbella albertanoniae]|uniref:phospholipase C n=1 Tax=Kribbella albertanoniae TaxID=1266829 RepID=A0A4R4PKP0_9ACTN|nr:phospholipase C, phosphocholine-specific [Kribbella albertanoniae]TDC22528.1 phospholipase C, phosphocholine-specific [Kribbella albertanoniae]
MPDINRRRFLQLAGASAGFAAMANSIGQAAAIPAQHRYGDINDVEHIVVLMQENRSFDHYFGTMKGVRGFGDPRPVVMPNGRPVFYQRDKAGKEVPPFHPDADDLGLQFLTGLPHSWPDGHAAINRGNYDNWIPGKGHVATMAYLTREDMPFHYALADKFTLCDSYHCSFIGATDPNRYYLLSGYTGNDGTGGGPVLGNDELGYGWTTYPERLEQAGVSWKVYQDIGDGLDAAGSWGWIDDAYRGNYGDNSLLYFNNYRNAKPGDPLFEKARTGTNAKAGEDYFGQLRADVKANRLPKISWIAAPEAFSEHSNWPTNYGAWYISRVLDALTSNPKVWSKTALFVTYDENDGFFDHIVPPFPPADANQGLSTVDVGPDNFAGDKRYGAGPYGLGPRVPMIVVSPWSTGGYTCSEVFDHTSVIRFMEKRFGVEEPNISPWRRAICGDLTSAFDFGTADSRPAPLPDTSAYEPPDNERHPTYVPTSPPLGELPGQERGSRRTRPLPYASIVDGASAGGRYTLTFSSGARAGAQFLVTAYNRTDGPWTYTTSAGKTLSDSWNATAYGGVYDLTVHSANGFLRAFKGKPATALEVTARDTHTGDVKLTFTTDVARKVTITNAYGGTPRTLSLRPGQTTHLITTTRRWYDVTVTTPTDPSYQRRFAGHVETGLPGLSDPAIRTV